VQEVGGFSVGEPRELSRARVEELADEVEAADYLRCLAMIQEAGTALERLSEHAAQEWEREAKARRGKQSDLKSRIDTARSGAERRRESTRSDTKSIFDSMSWQTIGCLAPVWFIGVACLGEWFVRDVLHGGSFSGVAGVILAIGIPVAVGVWPQIVASNERKRSEEELHAQLDQLEPALRESNERVRQIEAAGEIRV